MVTEEIIKKFGKKPSHKKRIFLWICFILIFMALIIVGFQVFLYFKLMIGNDIIVQTEFDKKYLVAKYGENPEISLSLVAITNPLCDISCESALTDISSNKKIIEHFKMFPGVKEERKIILNADIFGEGQKLYLAEIKCHTIGNFFCRTLGENVTRSSLLILEYSLDEANNLKKEETRRTLEDIGTKIELVEKRVNETNEKIKEISPMLELDSFNLNLPETSEFRKSLDLWENQDYPELFEVKLEGIKDLLLRVDNFISDTQNKISQHNSLIEVILNKNQEFSEVIQKEFSVADLIDLEDKIKLFNSKVGEFNSAKKIDAKAKIVEEIKGINLTKFSNVSYGVGEVLNITSLKTEVNLRNISFSPSNFSTNFTLTDPGKKCCYKGKCEIQNRNIEKIPVIFLHGHDFNAGVSAEKSLDTFTKIQDKLGESEMINAGEFNLYEKSFGGDKFTFCNYPLLIKSSYYFDIYEKEGSYIKVQTKTDSIDTYALRLKEIIDRVKYETGEEKVIIVAHSMGGLVVRKYAQIFGEESLDKVIFIATPNRGVTKDVLTICNLFGAEQECEDFDAGSLFLNKLNNGKPLTVPVVNIVGTGCSMKDDSGNEKDGDGAVIEESAELNWPNSKNLYIEGSCSGVDTMHMDILNPEKHPEIYEEILKDIIH